MMSASFSTADGRSVPAAECAGHRAAGGARPPASPVASAGPGNRPRWRSEDLLNQGAEADIEHAGQIYRLRKTALGKLILTK